MIFTVSKIFSTFFYVGLIKKAPGTFGTIAGMLAIAPVFNQLSMYDFQYLIYAIFLFGTFSTKIYIDHVKRDDPKECVIDEVLGVWICLAICKFFVYDQISIYTLFATSFVMFRFFDILKPFPISYIDKNLKNALGVMLDDILAGILAAIVIVLCVKIFL